MAFNLNACYDFGDASLGDFVIDADKSFENFNSYAAISAINENIIKINSATLISGAFENFSAGNVILIHCSAAKSSQTDKLGNYICAKILIAADNILTLDKNIEIMFNNLDLENYAIQAVTFANFKNLKINEGGYLSCQKFSQTDLIGGILALKCSDSLILNGGHISLVDCGIPAFFKDKLRPLTEQEISGTLDSDTLAGLENIATDKKFLLNSGDGAAFIIAKNISANQNSRIGNPKTHGKKLCRAADDTPFKPANVTNIGGSTILIATNNFNASANLLAKYRSKNISAGKGLARCFIASENLLDFDDKLYHADFISDTARLSKKFGLFDFGNGRNGDCDNPNFKVNSFANVIYHFKNQISVDKTTTNAIADFSVGSKIICFGDKNFCLAEIIAVNDTLLTLDKTVSTDTKYIISVAEFNSFTLSKNFSQNFLVIAVKNSCSISAQINCNSIIFAKNLSLSGNNLFSKNKKCFIVAQNLTGDIDSALPENAFIFLGN